MAGGWRAAPSYPGYALDVHTIFHTLLPFWYLDLVSLTGASLARHEVFLSILVSHRSIEGGIKISYFSILIGANFFPVVDTYIMIKGRYRLENRDMKDLIQSQCKI